MLLAQHHGGRIITPSVLGLVPYSLQLRKFCLTPGTKSPAKKKAGRQPGAIAIHCNVSIID